jgi:hypothetical protein
VNIKLRLSLLYLLEARDSNLIFPTLILDNSALDNTHNYDDGNRVKKLCVRNRTERVIFGSNEQIDLIPRWTSSKLSYIVISRY